MYLVRFERKDEKLDEEYFYHTLCDALVHFMLFSDDDSSLYSRISVVEIRRTHETIVIQKDF